MKADNKTYWEEHWRLEGLGWGAFMFIITEIVLPLVEKEELIITKLAFALLYWLFAGLIYGFTSKLFMRWYYKRLEKKKASQT